VAAKNCVQIKHYGFYITISITFYTGRAEYRNFLPQTKTESTAKCRFVANA